ncbi:MAG: ExbD/TolR family protein, partial [Lysobacteraceae bacterium]
PTDDRTALVAVFEGADPDPATRRVVLRADGRAPHQAVVTAMDALGKAGFTRLSIATTPEAEQ